MKKIFFTIKNLIFKHKIISSIIILVLLGAVYLGYASLTNTSGEIRYVLADVSKGTIISSVSGTGQVSASDQISLSPGSGASGKIVYLNAVSGQKVSAGTLLLQLDTTDAQKTVRDAENNLLSAQISLQKLEGISTLATPLNKQNAQDALNTDYENAYNNVSNAFIDLPGIMTGLQDILYGNTFNSYQQNIDYYTFSVYPHDESVMAYKASAESSYNTARTAYDKNFSDYKLTSRFSDNATVDSIISETYETERDIAQSIKDTNNLIQFYKDVLTKYNIKTSSIADTHLTSLNSYSSKTNSDAISLLNSQSTLKSDKTAISNADLDVTSQQLSLTKAQNAVADAKSALSNYYIYAPFGGIIGATSVKKGDTISSSTSAITFITQNQMTAISLSETDIPKIKMGDKAILTFDAISGLSITGKVTEIDTLGTVSQGVVSYNVQITFDTQDDRIKPGMSASVNIITDTQQNVLAVPNSAVKTKNGSSYVLVLSQKQDLTSATASQGFISKTAPTQKPVEIGLADDTNTQITSGLAEGDQVVVRTITSTAKASTSTSASRVPGITGGTFRPGN
ncbi:MAG: efflux RND transporter periplasmic adaptor subunit [Candidatus Staskawiczbacteria bacterium]|nr:efflux RND transporter periplasmic adaptor subunit [Candidatus Staskawiczbacteria bacterium]